MIQDAKCKFCGIPLKLEIDDSYAALRDPFGLVALACCNRCGDYRVERRNAIATIKESCYQLTVTKVSDEPRRKILRDLLIASTRIFANNLCKFFKTDGVIWDVDLPDAMVQHPKEWPKILSDYSRVVRKSVEQLTLTHAVPAPYRDD